MKTKSLIAILFIVLTIAYCSRAATVIVKISDFPNTPNPALTDLFVLASGATNKNISYDQLRTAIGTNGAPIQYITNLYVTQLNAWTNYTTNLWVINVLYASTNYTTNLFVTELYASTNYVTNLFVSTNYAYISYETNLFVTTNHTDTSFITNLFLINLTTNYYLFGTNTYGADTCASNYMVTNVFLDNYVSNFFATNVFVTNTDWSINITNFYFNDGYVSNYFNTNVFGGAVGCASNYFAISIYPLITITSNYMYNVAWPLTNATLWGTTTFAPESGSAAGNISMYSNGVQTVSINADGGSFTGDRVATKSAWFTTNLWAGPTNNLPLNKEDQFYIATSDCSITNLSNLPSAGYSVGILLSITNSAATNIVLRFPSTIVIPERTNAVVISNASQGMLSLRYSPVAGSNGVYRQF